MKMKAAELIDPETEIHYAFHSSLTEITPVHSHDFYEIFLISAGKARHIFNGNKQDLEEGALVFIRPDDKHGYEKINEKKIELVNIAFPKKTVENLLEYLGEGYNSERLLKAGDCPTIYLSETEKNIVLNKMVQLNTLPRENKKLVKTRLRILLADLLITYFASYDVDNKSGIPLWLERLHKEMEKKENFSAGLNRMRELCNKSPEHLARKFSQHYGKSPREYINELRLNYTANLLASSDLPIIEISMEAGFENLSHFYHLFREKYGTSPKAFREEHRRELIPGSN